MFIRIRTKKGRSYASLEKRWRVNGKVRSKVIWSRPLGAVGSLVAANLSTKEDREQAKLFSQYEDEFNRWALTEKKSEPPEMPKSERKKPAAVAREDREPGWKLIEQLMDEYPVDEKGNRLASPSASPQTPTQPSEQSPDDAPETEPSSEPDPQD